MNDRLEKCRVFVAPSLCLVEKPVWSESLPLLANVVNAVREDGNAQILQSISFEENSDHNVRVMQAYSNFFSVFCCDMDIHVSNVANIDESYFVITLRLGMVRPLGQKA